MPVYKKRATKVKKPPRIAQTQRTAQKVSQRVVVHIEQPKARVRRVAPRAMGTKDYQLKALLTRPMMPTPIQAGFDAAEAARQIAAQEKKLNEILELQARQVIQQQAGQQPGYYGTPVLQMAPPVPQPTGVVPPQKIEKVAPPPPPPPPPKEVMTDEQKDAARAIQVAAEELDDLRRKKSSTAFLGMSGEEWEEARKKLKKTPPASVASEEEEEPAGPSKLPEPTTASAMSKAETPQIAVEAQKPKKEEKETPSKKMGRPPIPEGTLTIGQMNDIKEKVLAGKPMTYDALAKYGKALKMDLPPKMKGASAGAKSRRLTFAKKIYDKLSREGVYD